MIRHMPNGQEQHSRQCANCGADCWGADYCSDQCYCDDNGLLMCDAGHTYDEHLTDCPECDEIESRVEPPPERMGDLR